ncbi:MAG: M18 family aminopeptidase [Eubacteriales bacterium]|nr:M18 family aminopeptidase [Eubacteriales bacterium]
MAVKTIPNAALEQAENLLNFIGRAPSAYQATAEVAKIMSAKGFREYQLKDLTNLKRGDKGYYQKNGSAIIAFVVGDEPLENGFRIIGAHTDSPTLRIKPNAISVNESVVRLCTEVYGGGLLNSYFDRPLSLAGRCVLKSGDSFKPEVRLVDFQEPLLILPNLCIHMNREANEGVKIERQKVLLPIVALSDECEEDWLDKLLADELGCDLDSILDYDLYIYEYDKPCFVGRNKEFISAGRLDNLFSTFCCFNALAEVSDHVRPGIQIALATDHEEVGSGSKQGAASAFIRDFLEALAYGLGANRQEFLDLHDKSYMISADCAHAVHPNYAEYADPTHRPAINGGPTIKVAASQAYSTDAYSAAIFRELCAGAEVPCQLFVNRSDLRGGSTIGPITSRLVPVATVDMGMPIWGMHSIRETGGTLDVYYFDKLCRHFYSA